MPRRTGGVGEEGEMLYAWYYCHECGHRFILDIPPDKSPGRVDLALCPGCNGWADRGNPEDGSMRVQDVEEGE